MNNRTDQLKKNPQLSDFQQYVKRMEETRGFTDQTVNERCLLLGEEVGELFKAVRKSSNLSIDDVNSKYGNVSEELADIFFHLCSIANRFDISLEESFREKEEFNRTRTWK